MLNTENPLEPASKDGVSNLQEQKYFRRSGTAKELGTQYEYKMATLLYLRALRTGMPFKMSTNDARAGDFDDIVIEFSDGRALMMQLKHKERNNAKITQQSLSSKNGPFALKKYFDSYCKMQTDTNATQLLNGAYFIIFTNASIDMKLKHCFIKVDPDLHNFLNTGGNRGNVLKLCNSESFSSFMKDETGDSNFLNNFIICSNQLSVYHIDELIKQEVMKIFKRIVSDITSIYNSLIQFVESWWKLDNECFCLTEACVGAFKKLFNDMNLFLSRINFRHSEVFNLGQRIHDSASQIIHVKYADAEIDLRSFKILQAMLKHGDFLLACLSDSQERLHILLDMWKKEWSDVLVIDDDDTTTPQRTLVDRIANILRENSSKKLVVVSGSSNSIFVTLLEDQLNIRQDKFEDICDFQQLDSSSMKELLECQIMLQGHCINLSSLGQNHALETILNGKLLSAFLFSENISIIGDCFPDIEKYIPRTVSKEIYLKIDILYLLHIPDIFLVTGITKRELQKFPIPKEVIGSRFIIVNESEIVRIEYKFREIGCIHEKTPIHWIHIENGGILWKQTYRYCDNLLEFVDRTEKSTSLADIQCLMKHCGTCCPYVEDVVRAELKTVILTGEPGIGKSFLLSVVAKILKQLYPSYWIIILNLNDFTDNLRKMQNCRVTLSLICEMLSDTISVNNEIYKPFVNALIHDSIENSENICILFDSFDEISPVYKDTVLIILRILHQSNISVLWVATRRIVEESVENELESKPFVIQPLSDDQQVQFFSNYWDKTHAEDFFYMIRDKFTLQYKLNFCSIPLHIKMFLEVYTQCITEGNLLQIAKTLNIHNLYKNFIEWKFKVYCSEKSKMNLINVSAQDNVDLLYITFMERHTLCSLVVLNIVQDLDEYQRTIIENKVKQYVDSIQSGAEKTGIIDRVIDEKPHFIHHSFVEYFSAVWLAQNKDMNIIFIRQFLFESKYGVVKNVFDQILAEKYSLHQSVLNDDIEEVTHILESSDSSINETDSGGRTPLHLAAQNKGKNSRIILELLLNKKADKELKDVLMDFTPLSYAAKCEAWDIVNILLQKGAKILNNIANKAIINNLIDMCIEKKYIQGSKALYTEFEVNWRISNRDMTPLHLAALCRNEESAILLLKKGANANVRTSAGVSPLHLCAENLNIVKLLVESKANINAIDDCGFTPLHYAVSKKCVKVVKYLLKNHADINVCSSRNETPLHMAIKRGKTELIKYVLGIDVCNVSGCTRIKKFQVSLNDELNILRMLLDSGADTNIRSKYGYTPTHIAVKEYRPNMLKLLLQYGANINVLDLYDESSIFLAARRQGPAVLKVLLENKANIMVKNRYGDSPLHMAVRSNVAKSVKLLLQYKANVNVKGMYSDTPLHIATRKESSVIMKLLLDSGAETSSRDRFGNTPLHIACRQRSSNLVKILLEYGANPALQERFGHTPLDIAIRWEYNDIAKNLKESPKNISNFTKKHFGK